MSKRNTVRINMDLLDGYLTAKNITPKEFCETRLGFTDGWYYGIRKNGGRGVKVLVAQLIARSIGVEYETLVIPEEDTGRKTAAGASPRPTERAEEKTLISDYVDMEKELEFRRALLEEARLEIKKAYEEIDELKQEKVNLSFRLEQAEASSCPTETQPEEPRKHSAAELFPELSMKKLAQTLLDDITEETDMICVSYEDMLDAVLDFALITDGTHEEVKGFMYAVNSMIEKSNARKERKKNARPEED